MRESTLSALLILSLGLSLMYTGCSKEKMQSLVDGAKESASDLKSSADGALSKAKQAVESAGDLTSATDFTGSASINLESPTEFASCYIRLVQTDETTTNFLQLKSTQDDTPEKFPSFLIQGKTDAKTLAELNGTSVSCRCYAQKTEEGDVWSNQVGDPLVLTVSKTDGRWSAKFSSSTLVNAARQTEVSSKGSFACVEF